MADILTPPKPGTQNGTVKKERKTRISNEESIKDQLSRQPLKTKVSLLAYLKSSIQEDKKKLEDELKLITE